MVLLKLILAVDFSMIITTASMIFGFAVYKLFGGKSTFRSLICKHELMIYCFFIGCFSGVAFSLLKFSGGY